MKKAKWMLLGIAVLGVGFGLFCMAVDWHEASRRRAQDRPDAERFAHLNVPVRGYITEDDLARTHLQATSVEYLGGSLREVEYVQGKLFYRERDEERKPAELKESLVEVTGQQRELLLDIANLVCKQKLWDQGDAFPASQVEDGGEFAFQFTVGSHSGKFKIVNTNPKHLEMFLYKCGNLMRSCEPKESGH